MIRNVLIVSALAAGVGTAAAQTSNPPPVKSPLTAANSQKVGVDLGWSMISGLEVDVSGTDIDLDYTIMPTFNVTYQYGLQENLGVGVQLCHGEVDFDGAAEDDTAWTLDFTVAYAAIHDPTWALAPFAAFGMTDEKGPHFSLGVITEYPLVENLRVCPYLMLSRGNFDDRGGDVMITTLRLGADAVYAIKPNLDFVVDFAFEQQTWDVSTDAGSGDGIGGGFSFSVGVQYTLTTKQP